MTGPTADGTGPWRDYNPRDGILAEVSRAADVLLAEAPQHLILNLGSGQGHSVAGPGATAFERPAVHPIAHRLVRGRPGDVRSRWRIALAWPNASAGAPQRGLDDILPAMAWPGSGPIRPAIESTTPATHHLVLAGGVTAPRPGFAHLGSWPEARG